MLFGEQALPVFLVVGCWFLVVGTLTYFVDLAGACYFWLLVEGRGN